jgi:hypothetical protein
MKQEIERMYQKAGELTDFCVSMLKVMLLSDWKLPSFPAPLSKDCYLIVNGPSFSKVLADESQKQFLQQQTTLCVNMFAATPLYQYFKPSYYVFMDPLFFEYSREVYKDPEAHGIEVPGEEVRKVFANIDAVFAALEATTWPLVLFVPAKYKKSVWFGELSKKNKNIRLAYFNSTKVDGSVKGREWFYKRGLGVPSLQNVLTAGIYLGIQMQFERLFILGADHNWFLNLHVAEDNTLHLKDEHFYDGQTEVKLRPVITYQGQKAVSSTVSQVFLAFHKAFRTYDLLAAYAKRRGCKVYNISEPSFIDAFERKSIQELAGVKQSSQSNIQPF